MYLPHQQEQSLNAEYTLIFQLVCYLAHVDLYIPVKRASGKIGIPSSFPSSFDELSYLKSTLILKKKVPFVMSADDSNSTVVTVSVQQTIVRIEIS